jgi:hypothetical protein
MVQNIDVINMEQLIDDFYKFLSDEKKDYITMLTKRRIHGELWFDIELAMFLDKKGIDFNREVPYGKGHYGDFFIGKDVLELKVRVLKGKLFSPLTNGEVREFGRLAEINDGHNKWVLVFTYGDRGDWKQAVKVSESHYAMVPVHVWDIPFDNAQCKFFLWRVE